MEENNDNNNKNNENHHQQQQQQQQQQAADVAWNTTATTMTDIKFFMDHQDGFPSRQQTNINDLVEKFLTNLGDNIHGMLCDWNEGDDYCRLARNWDTKAKVQTVIQFFLEFLLQRGGEDKEWFPIQCLSHTYDYMCNVKPGSFVHVLDQLAIEFGSFQENEWGGMLVYNGHPLKGLVYSSNLSYGEEHNEIVDNVFLAKIMLLRQMSLLGKENIQEYELVHILCKEYYFAEMESNIIITYGLPYWSATTPLRCK